MSSNHSTLSLEKITSLLGPLPTHGTHKVKYNAYGDWDFQLDTCQKQIDLSLILPHYRARHQPVDHRMNMFVGNIVGQIKLKVCRSCPRSRFFLEVRGETSNVTVWLPSDFKGRIHHTGKASFSAGFINRIMRNASINESDFGQVYGEEDDVFVDTRGHVTFRMWDAQTCAPENPPKESFKRMFGCKRKAPETPIDWDFLLRD